MLAFEKYGIRLTRGDTVRFAIRFRGRVLPGGTTAVFTVKKAPWRNEEEIRKVLTAESLTDGGRLYVALDAADTDIAPGAYVWDVRLYMPTGEGGTDVYTPMEYAAFQVMEAIGNE